MRLPVANVKRIVLALCLASIVLVLLRSFSPSTTIARPLAAAVGYRIHIMAICIGDKSRYMLTGMISSLAATLDRARAATLHMVADEMCAKHACTFADALRVRNIELEIHDEDRIEVPFYRKSWTGAFGPAPFIKLAVHEILHALDKVIMVDVDVLFYASVSELWNEFDRFETAQMMGAAMNHAPYYDRKDSKHWPGHRKAEGLGINGGVLLCRLDEMRASNFTGVWRVEAERVFHELDELDPFLAEQDILNALFGARPGWLYEFPCAWNFQLADENHSDHCAVNESIDIKLLHYNGNKEEVLRRNGVAERRGREYRRHFLRLRRDQLKHNLELANYPFRN